MSIASRRSGHGDRRDPVDRRSTVSGALPNIKHIQTNNSNVEEMRFPWSSPSAPTSPTSPTARAANANTPSPAKSTSGRKRSFSNNVFSRLNFLRSDSGSGDRPSLRPMSRDKEATSPTKSLFSRKSIDDDSPTAESPTSPSKETKEGTLSLALSKASKSRKRKGSLRKTALLGGRWHTAEGRERRGTVGSLQRTPSDAKSQDQRQASPVGELGNNELSGPQQVANLDGNYAVDDDNDRGLHRQFSYENPVSSSRTESGWAEPAAVSQARLSLLTEHQRQPHRAISAGLSTVNDLGSPIDAKSPISQASTISTTSDDDLLTLPSHPLPRPISIPLDSAPTSYFPRTYPHRRSTRRSPLSRTLPLNDPQIAQETGHDYTETATWGWLLLLATWLTFTVGMGSCLEIWSWAWDVGETPYAPPELEDDPTLPIVGYYPALMVLTGVVAWVWITVAWVGMKYFRHAKIEV